MTPPAAAPQPFGPFQQPTTSDNVTSCPDQGPLTRGPNVPGEGYSVMEAVAFRANEPWSERPTTASPVLTEFLLAWGRALDDERRQALRRYVHRLVGSRGAPEVEVARQWLIVDWTVRGAAVLWLRAAGLEPHARHLARQPVVGSNGVLDALRPVVEGVDAEVRALRDAEWLAVSRAVVPEPDQEGLRGAGEAQAGAHETQTWAAVADGTRTASLVAHDLTCAANCAAAMTAVPPSPHPTLRSAIRAIHDTASAIAWSAVRVMTSDDSWSWHTSPERAWSLAYRTASAALAPAELRVHRAAHELVERLLSDPVDSSRDSRGR